MIQHLDQDRLLKVSFFHQYVCALGTIMIHRANCGHPWQSPPQQSAKSRRFKVRRCH
jgi:hypothetical protein